MVTLHYTLTVDGEEVDSSRGGQPLQYEHGSGQIIPGLEEHLEGKSAGHTGVHEVAPEKAYGLPDPEARQVVPREAFRDPDMLEDGMMVSGRDDDGQAFDAKVTEVTAETVTLDFNHPLAGKMLVFDVEIVSVV